MDRDANIHIIELITAYAGPDDLKIEILRNIRGAVALRTEIEE